MKKNSILTVCLYIVGIILVCAIVIKLMPFIFVGGLAGLWYNTKKKPNQKWRNYSIVAIVIGLVGSAIFLPSTQKETTTPSSTKITSSTTTTTKKKKATQQNFATKPSVDKKIVEAEKAVGLLEQKTSREQYVLAVTALSKVTDSQKKAEFQTRLEVAEQKLIAQEAEKAVKYLEDNQYRNNVDSANEKVNKVVDEALRGNLTQRVDAVVNAINIKEEQAAAEAAAQQQNRVVYVARQGTANVYWYSKNSMPSNTNWNNVVEMTEADAIANGKRPSKRE